MYDLDDILDPDIITYDVTTPAYLDALVEYTGISDEAVKLSVDAIAKRLR